MKQNQLNWITPPYMHKHFQFSSTLLTHLDTAAALKDFTLMHTTQIIQRIAW